MAGNGIGRTFLKAAGSTIASSLLGGVADAAAARGDLRTADIARKGQSALGGSTLTPRGSDDLRRPGQTEAPSVAQQLGGAVFDAAMQLLQPGARARATATLNQPGGAECFNRGDREQRAGNPAAARHWFERGAARGDADCARRLARMTGPGLPGQVPPPSLPKEGLSADRAQALEILGLREGAGADDIRAAYHRLMRQVHPDRGGGSDFFAKQLNAARQTLLG